MDRWAPETEDDRDSFDFVDSINAKNRVVVGLGEFAGNGVDVLSTESRPYKPVYLYVGTSE